MGGQRIGYVRVSTVDQNPERQLADEKLDRIFGPEKASGKDAKRPILEEALRYVRKGDELVIHSMDRLGRSLRDLVEIVEGLVERGVVVSFIKERLTFDGKSTDPFAKLQLQLFAAVAEFERAIIKERQREGIAAARAKRGKIFGRPRVLDDEKLAEAKRLRESGMQMTSIAKELNVARSTLYNAVREGRL